MWVHWLLLDSLVFTSILQSMYSHVPSKSQCSHMWVHWLKNCAITFNLHDKLFYSVATIVVFNNGSCRYVRAILAKVYLWIKNFFSFQKYIQALAVKSKKITQEQRRSERLILKLLPTSVATRLIEQKVRFCDSLISYIFKWLPLFLFFRKFHLVMMLQQ